MKHTNKGFTLIELIISVALMGVMMITLFEFDNRNTIKNKINEMYYVVNEIINETVYNPIKGYVSDKGDDCSSNYDTKDITAIRVKKCANLTIDIENGSDDYNPSDSYFYFLDFLSDSDHGCKIYFGSNSNYVLKIFVNCENLKDNFPSQVEQGLSAYLQKKNVISVKQIYGEAEDLNTTTGGSYGDGKVLIYIEK